MGGAGLIIKLCIIGRILIQWAGLQEPLINFSSRWANSWSHGVVQVRIEWNDKIKQIKTKEKRAKDENIEPGFRPEVVLIFPKG